MKYPKFTKLRHIKTNVIYMVIGTPDKTFIENGNVPAYAYQKFDDNKAKIWIRPQAEMEDGRFDYVIDK